MSCHNQALSWVPELGAWRCGEHEGVDRLKCQHGSQICPHSRVRSACKECNPCRHGAGPRCTQCKNAVRLIRPKKSQSLTLMLPIAEVAGAVFANNESFEKRQLWKAVEAAEAELQKKRKQKRQPTGKCKRCAADAVTGFCSEHPPKRHKRTQRAAASARR